MVDKLAEKWLASCSYSVSSVIRGHHVYTWTPFIAEQLLLEAENGNLEDRHAVAVINSSTCLIQLHPQCHAYNTWAFIQDGRLLTKTELLPWAFKRDGRLIEEGV